MSMYGENVETVERRPVGEVVPFEPVETIFRIERTNGDVDYLRQTADGEREEATVSEWDDAEPDA